MSCPVLAAPFGNLGFDSGDTNALSPPGAPIGTGPTVALLPNWELSQGGTQKTVIAYNSSVASWTIFNNTPPFGLSYFPVDGSYALQLAERPGDPPIVLAQDGQIPTGTVLLGFSPYTEPNSGTEAACGFVSICAPLWVTLVLLSMDASAGNRILARSGIGRWWSGSR
jgi:hypothetical protein